MKLFRQEHAEQILAYEEAKTKLKEFYSDGKFPQLKDLKDEKVITQKQLDDLKTELKCHKNYHKDLEAADANVTAILDVKVPQKHKSNEKEL